ncbi:MAG TPA: hypothetical protein VF060_00395 [Trebonia sp.]
MPERTVRDRLRMDGVATRTRGGRNREDRDTVPAEVLDLLYTRLGGGSISDRFPTPVSLTTPLARSPAGVVFPGASPASQPPLTFQ